MVLKYLDYTALDCLTRLLYASNSNRILTHILDLLSRSIQHQLLYEYQICGTEGYSRSRDQHFLHDIRESADLAGA